jgi:hypothetical protein
MRKPRAWGSTVPWLVPNLAGVMCARLSPLRQIVVCDPTWVGG